MHAGWGNTFVQFSADNYFPAKIQSDGLVVVYNTFVDGTRLISLDMSFEKCNALVVQLHRRLTRGQKRRFALALVVWLRYNSFPLFSYSFHCGRINRLLTDVVNPSRTGVTCTDIRQSCHRSQRVMTLQRQCDRLLLFRLFLTDIDRYIKWL